LIFDEVMDKNKLAPFYGLCMVDVLGTGYWVFVAIYYIKYSITTAKVILSPVTN